MAIPDEKTQNGSNRMRRAKALRRRQTSTADVITRLESLLHPNSPFTGRMSRGPVGGSVSAVVRAKFQGTSAEAAQLELPKMTTNGWA